MAVWNCLLLRNLLLAHVFDDPLRWAAHSTRLRFIDPGRNCRRHLSWIVRPRGRTVCEEVGCVGTSARANILGRLRMGASRSDGSTLERSRLLPSLLFIPHSTREVGR